MEKHFLKVSQSYHDLKIAVITNKFSLLELIIKRDEKLMRVLSEFESKLSVESTFLEQIHNIISKFYYLS